MENWRIELPDTEIEQFTLHYSKTLADMLSKWRLSDCKTPVRNDNAIDRERAEAGQIFAETIRLWLSHGK